MRSVAIALALATIFMAQIPYATLLNESEQYFFQNQLPCGGFFNCDYAPNRFDAFIGYVISDKYPLSYQLAKAFIEQNYEQYPLSSIMAPDSGIYAWGPFYDTLAILSMNDTSPVVAAMEKIILDQWSSTGLHVGTDRVYLYPNSPYDFMATLMALEIAAKSKRVDGNLDDSQLLATLDPNFWTALTDYLRSPTVDINTYDTSFNALIVVSLGYPYYREQVCDVLNDTYFSVIYEHYLNATPVTEYGIHTLIALGNAAMICAAYGYLNLTYAKEVEYWALISVLVRNGQFPIDDAFFQDSCRLMLGMEPRVFSVFMADTWPGIEEEKPVVTQIMNVTVTATTTTTQLVIRNSTTTKTLVKPYVVTSTEVIMASAVRGSFASPALLAVLVSKVKKRRTK